MNGPIEVRDGTPAEREDVARQIEGVPSEPLFRLTFYGHLVPNPEPGTSGTLAPAISGHKFEYTSSVPGEAADAVLPVLLRHFLARLEDGAM